MTKQVEIARSARMFQEILNDQGVYLALMFLADSGYSASEIRLIANEILIRENESFEVQS